MRQATQRHARRNPVPRIGLKLLYQCGRGGSREPPSRRNSGAARILNSPHRIDILFTDIRLPGSLDGWEVARVARRARTALPVIYATGYTVDRMAEVPGAIFLHKPYQPSTIVETIRRLLR